jgi:hypothetical protein
MKRIIILLVFLSTVYTYGQVFAGTPVSGFPSGTTAEITALSPSTQGIVAYSTDEKIFYYYDGTSWLSLRPTLDSAKIFYPPSVAIDASTTGTGRTLNLYSEYISQFGSPAVVSSGAPTSIPTYAASDLYYYVTAYDTNVLTITSIDASGLMTYNVDNVPSDDNTIINVVFVVK